MEGAGVDFFQICVFAYLCRVFACNTPKDIFGRFCVRIDIWWWLWRFWWSDATRLLEVNRSEGEGDPDRASANKMEKRQKDKNTKRQKYKIQNTKCKYKIQIAKKMSKIYHLKKKWFSNFSGFSTFFEKLQCQFKFSIFNFFEFFFHSNTHWYLVVLGRTKNQTLFWASFQEVWFFGLDR